MNRKYKTNFVNLLKKIEKTKATALLMAFEEIANLVFNTTSRAVPRQRSILPLRIGQNRLKMRHFGIFDQFW